MDTVELAGILEIAREFGVPRTTASMWDIRREVNGFPEPIVRLSMGPVFDLNEVRAWAASRVVPRQMRKSV